MGFSFSTGDKKNVLRNCLFMLFNKEKQQNWLILYDLVEISK